MPELPVEERLDGFREVELGLPEGEARREAQRCLQCGRMCYRQETRKESATSS